MKKEMERTTMSEEKKWLREEMTQLRKKELQLVEQMTLLRRRELLREKHQMEEMEGMFIVLLFEIR